MEVAEDFESRPHKAVTFLVARDKEIQAWRELDVERSAAEGGREEEQGVRRV